MSDKDGGPAFPKAVPVTINDQTQDFGQGGMSLRDWFAGQALVGITTAVGSQVTLAKNGKPISYAAYAYELADDMLKVREALAK